MRSARLAFAFLAAVLPAVASEGYYRFPALRGETIVFVAEGDLWKVGLRGGTATRLTSHPGDETTPAISPDGKTVGFVGHYEGPSEVYTMPIGGGVPVRRTFEGGRPSVTGFTPDGRLMYTTNARSGLPSFRLFTIDLASGERQAVPLAEASDGAFDATGRTLFFTRLAFQGSHTKRYRGGTVQQLWRFSEGDAEARALTADFAGTSKRALWWNGRVHFLSDRDGTMNVWSMDPDGRDLRQHTRHDGWDAAGASLDDGRIVYQCGADLRLLDLRSGADSALPITLDSDFDQERERWVKKPWDYLTSAHLSPDGGRVVLTARGRVFVAPREQGRLVEIPQRPGVRHRNARFMPDGKSLVALSDATGEVELWTLPADGLGAPAQLTSDGKVLRWDSLPSPDGALIAHHDKDQRLYVHDVARKSDTLIDASDIDSISDPAWSPDGRYLAYVVVGPNLNQRIRIHRVADGAKAWATTDRYDSWSPSWSPDGKWLYFLSDRHLDSLVRSPWGSLQPEPFFDRRTKVYLLALSEGQRSPFQPDDELQPKEPDADQDGSSGAETKTAAKKPAGKADAKPGAKPDAKPDAKPEVKIDFDGLERRLAPVPVPPGNYSGLLVTEKIVALLSAETTVERKSHLVGFEIGNKDVEVKTIVPDADGAELSLDRKWLLVRKGEALYVIEPAAKTAELDKKKVDLAGWTLALQPREEWRQMFVEAWRLERDYFYDRNMHGVDWAAMKAKYLPLVDRVRSRAELSDVLAQLVSELSALHIFVRGGDLRKGDEMIVPGSLGAELERDAAGGGARVVHVYRSDPDRPEIAAPLARPGVDVRDGDVIAEIDGVPVLSVLDPAQLLRGKAGRQVLLRVKPGAGGAERKVIVVPSTLEAAADLRYHEWEYTRRLRVEQASGGRIGYVHLRAMGTDDFAAWAREFYPVFTREGLVIDVRDNRGGNIDSWIVGRLLRKAWSYWSQRVGQAPYSNMQYAFNGHVAVLCNHSTASDGEAFTMAVQRLKLGTVIGTRTWGGEIWLTSSNVLVDRGIATAAEMGVFGPEGEWLIEGHGVDPDIVVDNLPHATFGGADAQLDAAIAHLEREIRAKPVRGPVPPKHPDKSARP